MPLPSRFFKSGSVVIVAVVVLYRGLQLGWCELRKDIEGGRDLQCCRSHCCKHKTDAVRPISSLHGRRPGACDSSGTVIGITFRSRCR